MEKIMEKLYKINIALTKEEYEELLERLEFIQEKQNNNKKNMKKR